MKDNIKKILFVGIPFGITVGIVYGIITNSAHIGIISGVFLGVSFGFIIWLFILIQGREFKKNCFVISEGKEIIMEGEANHFRGKESVGGRLYLYDDKVVFKSHKFNFQNHQTIIAMNKINEVRTSSTLGFIPNGLQIITDSYVEKFVVNKRKDWIQRINAVLLTKK